eukprot:434970_1
MCGIFALLCRNYGKKYNLSELFKNLAYISGRGPDSTKIIGINSNVFYGFHRLAINDLTILGDQPMRLVDNETDIHLICNGEIYNHLQIEREFGFKTQGASDCEVILHLYKHFGDINEVANRLDGVFAFTLYDAKKDILFAGRDPIGVRPLFIGFDPDNDGIFFASESKSFNSFCSDIKQFPPGSTWTSSEPNKYSKWWNIENYISHSESPDMIIREEDALISIHDNLIEATKKRLMSDRKIGTFLSGGLDSSLITALVNKYNPYKVNTYSVGMYGGTDFHYADKVAKHLNTNHTEIIFTAEQGIEAVDRVIYALETYDITTIRASIGMYLMSEYVSLNSDDIVIYSGEGADEVSQGYLYFHNAPCSIEGSIDSKRLMDNLHYFDVKRVDRTVSCHGLEVRVPFLDKKFITDYFKIDPKLRTPAYKGIEKYLIRKAFDKDNILPSQVLWRTKEALSDGVSSQKESWYEILSNYVDTIVTDDEYEKACIKYSQFGNKNVPIHKEAYYYRKLYEKHFGDVDLIPYYWMPQWSDAKDPSARTINKYKQLMDE